MGDGQGEDGQGEDGQGEDGQGAVLTSAAGGDRGRAEASDRGIPPETVEFPRDAAIFRARSAHLPILEHQPMAPEDPNSVKRPGLDLGGVGTAVRWTLGNLEQAFDQALDEAFRTCLSIVDELDGAATGLEAPSGTEPDARRAEAERFRSCEGPLADGAPGEGFQPPPEPGIVAA